MMIDVYVAPGDARRGLADDVRRGLAKSPKDLPPKWFYDAAGSELFDRITRLPEYYPTETERAILRAHAADIAAAAGADTLVELGSGSSDKTRVLLDALVGQPRFSRYVPFDVSESALVNACNDIATRYPQLDIHGVVGDFDRHLDAIPSGGRRLIAFLGGTIGNYPPEARSQFLAKLAAQMAPGDSLLLGTDLVKDEGRLVRAYDDSQGVTAAFNKNVLSVINRELRADFDASAFAHVAVWDRDNEWIEMRLRSREAQVVHVRALEMSVAFGRGEEMRTEISAKFRRERVAAELADVGLALAHWYTDPAADFALSLSTRV